MKRPIVRLSSLQLTNIKIVKNGTIYMPNTVNKILSADKAEILGIYGQNGSGKSLLFSSIPNIVDGCPPLAKKKDAKVLHNESSGIAIKYRNDGVEYSLKQISKNNSLSYKISKNDEDILDGRKRGW